MAITVPVLDLFYLDSHSSAYLAIADVSEYPTPFNIVSPTIVVTIPSGGYVTLTFTPRQINILDSTDLGITCGDDSKVDLPDGVYKFKYQIGTSKIYSVEKSFLRTDKLQEKYDAAFLKLDLANCDFPTSVEQKKYLDNINIYIQEAIAAANQCALDVASKLYNKATRMLDNFLKETSCVNCR